MDTRSLNQAWVSVLTLSGTQAFQTETHALFPSAFSPTPLDRTLGFGKNLGVSA